MQAFVQAVNTLVVHLERDLELQVGYFIRDHHLEDATAIALDTWAKEADDPTNQRIGIERAADKAIGAVHVNGAEGARCKYGAAGLWCKYGA